jgi:hypothetical protein
MSGGVDLRMWRKERDGWRLKGERLMGLRLILTMTTVWP